MIRVLMQNVYDFDFPLDNGKYIAKRGKSKRILKRLEKQYNLKSHIECRKYYGTYPLYANVANFYVPREEKRLWIENYENYVRSSLKYRVYINFIKKLV